MPGVTTTASAATNSRLQPQRNAKKPKLKATTATTTTRKRSKSTSSSSSSSSSSSGDKEEEGDVEWLGPSFSSDRSDRSYGKVRLAKSDEYELGDSVWVETLGYDDPQPMVLKELWEDESGEKWAYGTWYYYSWEIGKAKTKGALPNELFESDAGDIIPIEALKTSFKVVDKKEDVRNKSTYLCRNMYVPSTKFVFPKTRKYDQLRQVGSKNTRIGEEEEDNDEDDDSENGDSEQNKERAKAKNKNKGLYDEFDKAKDALQLSAIPESLPCRDKERESIRIFLTNGIQEGGSRLALYISGMPGTGKTATVHEVVRSLQAQQRQGKLSKFRFFELNALKLPNPEEAYTVLANLILNDTSSVSALKACQALDTYFSSSDSKREVCVLLVDEIDHLVTKKQQVLYNLFDWPQRQNAKLVVVGIANTIDLPERLLPRIQSRLGEDRIAFAPYKREQIESIVHHRLQGTQVFEKDAIDFAARKVATLSGDVRRALQLCRRAVEICRRADQKRVTIEHVNLAVREIDSKVHCVSVLNLGLAEKLFLVCVYKHCKAISQDRVLFQDVYFRFKNISRIIPELVPMVSNPWAVSRVMFLLMVDKLVKMGLLTADSDRRLELGPSLALTFDYEDIKMVLQASDTAISPYL